MSEVIQSAKVLLLMNLFIVGQGCKTFAPTYTETNKANIYVDSLTKSQEVSGIRLSINSSIALENQVNSYLPDFVLKSSNFPHYSHGDDCPMQWLYSARKSLVKIFPNRNKLMYTAAFPYYIDFRDGAYSRIPFGCCELDDYDCGTSLCGGAGKINLDGSTIASFDTNLNIRLKKGATKLVAEGSCDYWLNLAGVVYQKFLNQSIDNVFGQIESQMNNTNYLQFFTDISYFLNNKIICNADSGRKHCFTLNISRISIPTLDFESENGMTPVSIRSIFYGNPKYQLNHANVPRQLTVDKSTAPASDIKFYFPLEVPSDSIEKSLTNHSSGSYRYGKIFYKHIKVDSFKITGYNNDSLFFSAFFTGPLLNGTVNLFSLVSFHEKNSFCDFAKVTVHSSSSLQLKRKNQLRLFERICQTIKDSVRVDFSAEKDRFIQNLQTQFNIAPIVSPALNIQSRFQYNPADGYKIFFSDDRLFVLKSASAQLDITVHR